MRNKSVRMVPFSVDGLALPWFTEVMPDELPPRTDQFLFEARPPASRTDRQNSGACVPSVVGSASDLGRVNDHDQ